jgi:hypothetical protein
MSEPKKQPIKKLEMNVPRSIAAAALQTASRYGKSLDAYCAGAILRQLLDDGLDIYSAGSIALSMAKPDANNNDVLNEERSSSSFGRN